ncbi:hypothetical protein C6P46_004149 [Rhodotorula mucilaginosa]|uniref:Uncharacterized protein n=1 Tax=Rhodotorula mucilaginosa TaxID=5537 RepID=A0A9P7B6H1_RHOMI|nr:hypothetical protein C6P46_004149 [Rhodotorula mucilaginosa]
MRLRGRRKRAVRAGSVAGLRPEKLCGLQKWSRGNDVSWSTSPPPQQLHYCRSTPPALHISEVCPSDLDLRRAGLTLPRLFRLLSATPASNRENPAVQFGATQKALLGTLEQTNPPDSGGSFGFLSRFSGQTMCRAAESQTHAPLAVGLSVDLTFATERKLTSSFSISRQADAMEEIDQALDDLVQLAKPPVQLALPGHVLKSVHQHLETWKRDLLSRLGPPDPDFAEQVTAYHKWFHQSLAEHHALHHDIYVALVSPVLPQSAGAALTAFLYQLATRFSDFGGMIDYDALQRAVATRHGPERHSANYEREAVHLAREGRMETDLEQQFKRAAMVAAGVQASDAVGHRLAERPLSDVALREWAEAGVSAVSKESLDAGRVFGTLELLERLTLACNDLQPDDPARRNLLLVRTQ